MFNVYKTPAKEDQVVDPWATDEIWVSEILFSEYLEYFPTILRNYKTLKSTKMIIFTISSFINPQYVLLRTAE